MPRKRSKNYKENLRKIAELNLFSDFFMTICFDKKPKLTEKVLSIILNEPGLKVNDVKTQVTLTNSLGRSAKLDVKAQDSLGRCINIEVQRKNEGAVPRRARFHSSLLDVSTLKEGQKFHELSDNYVIFITEHDYFKKKMPIYEITRAVKQTGEDFKDGSFIIYVSGDYRDFSPIGKLMHDFSCTKSQDMYYNELAEVVKYYKETEEGQEFMCQIIDKMCKKERAAGRKEGERRGLSKGRAEGRKEGRLEGKKELIISILQTGKYSLAELAGLSGLSLDEVKALQDSISGNG